jgi:hypothetical protein
VDGQNVSPSVCSSHSVPPRWRTVEKHSERPKDVSRGQITPGIINFSVTSIESSQRQFIWPSISTDYTAIYPRIEFLTITVRTSFPKTNIISDAAVKIVCTDVRLILV